MKMRDKEYVFECETEGERKKNRIHNLIPLTLLFFLVSAREWNIIQPTNVCYQFSSSARMIIGDDKTPYYSLFCVLSVISSVC